MDEFTLMKFIKNKYVDNFLDGKLYMNFLRYFVELEKVSNDPDIGDLFEGQLPIYDLDVDISKDGDSIMKAKSKMMILDFGYLDCPTLCLYRLERKNLIENKENGKSKYIFSEMQKRELKVFGDKCILLNNPMAFINRIEDAALKNDFDVYHEKINYYAKNEQIHFKDVIKNKYKCAYWKRMRYNYQSEFRILCDFNLKFRENYVLDIGSIRDIAKVVEANDILNTYFTFN